MKSKTERHIEESYQMIKRYLNDEDETHELREMCKHCENYCGKEHDYKECKGMMCFKFFLAYNYLDWVNGY